MFIGKLLQSVFNLIFIVAALVGVSSLGEMTYDMAVNAGKESKRGFLSISKLNQQLQSGDQSR